MFQLLQVSFLGTHTEAAVGHDGVHALSVNRTSSHVRVERFHILGALCVAAMLASLLLQASGGLALTLGLVLQGIARSSLMTVLILALVELPGIGEQRVGVASGLFFSAAEVGGVLGPLGIGVVYDTTGSFIPALVALFGVALLMLAGSVYLRQLARAPGA